MKKTTDAAKRTLKEQFNTTANGYLIELLRMYEWDRRDGFWIGDEIGGTYAHGDNFFVNYDDMRFIVDNDVPLDVYESWTDYVLFAIEYNQNQPNLKAWVSGCPRLSEEQQRQLVDKKTEFENLMHSLKERF